MSWLTPDLIDILLSILKAVVILLVVVTCGAFMSFGERRLLGLFQNRYGPNRVGWGGSLQLVADMIKMFFKEDWIPRFSDRVIFTLAPVIAFTSLLLAFAIVPVSPTWVVADLNIGILFFLMMAGLAVYAVLFAGWSSNNKYSLLGAMRASAQTLSYEVFLGLSLMGVVAQAGSFNMTDIVNNQAHLWNVIPQFFGFVTFAIAGVAVCHRHPFDQGAVIQMIAHGLSAAGLFILCGQLYERLHTRDMRQMGGLWSKIKWLPAMSMFFAVATLGMPGTGNFVGEFMILFGSYKVVPTITVISTFGLVFASVYSLSMLHRAYFGKAKSEVAAKELPGMSLRELSIILLLVLLLVLLGFFPQPILDTSHAAMSNIQQWFVNSVSTTRP